MRFGVREICDVVLRAKAKMKVGKRTFYKNEPVMYFDTLRTSSLEGTSTTVYAQGGRGYPRLITWQGERSLTFNMEEALISPESFSILSGAGVLDASEVEGGAMYVHTTDQVVVTKANTINLADTACWNGSATGTPKSGTADDYYQPSADIFVMVLKNGVVDEEPCLPAAVEYSPDGTIITCYSHEGNLAPNTVVLVDYYVKRTAGAKQIEITPDKFGGAFYLEASTLFREESSGVDMPAEFVIPNCRVQSNFTFSMAATGDPSTFSFVMDAVPDYTKFDPTKKVLAVIQIIENEEDTDEVENREPCLPDPDIFVQDVSSNTESVVAIITSDNGKTCTISVEGEDVISDFDSAMFPGYTGNGAEIEFNMPIDGNGTYKIVSQNPAYRHFVTDPAITVANGIYTKSKTYTIDDDELTMKMILTDDAGPINVKLYDKDSVLLKTYNIINKVSFMA